jgi:hypothetical protein
MKTKEMGNMGIITSNLRKYIYNLRLGMMDNLGHCSKSAIMASCGNEFSRKAVVFSSVLFFFFLYKHRI